ncbi:odorant receptor 13a-like isoform X1 [Polyergus mexicanus]|uniref:odorant receptor 13a-like isoform X1 n=2 Tax=Polyergus mexicanus TaxID=615972 RepID=UPI0038B612B9
MQSAVKHYYNINKILITKIGGWPTQNNFIKILLPTIITTVLFSQAFFEFVQLTRTWRSITQDCECLIVLLVLIIGGTKLFTIILSNKNIERLLSLIDYHWRIFTHSMEIQIMHDYAIRGRKITISYIFIIYTLMCFYLLIPVTPQLLNIIKPLNKSRPYKYLFDVDYGIDKEIYYYPILIYSYLTTVMNISILVVVDTSYMMFVQHACSLFAAIGHRLENITLDLNSKKNNQLINKDDLTDYIQYDKDDDIYHELVLVLWKHQLSIEYVCFLDSSFTMYSFKLIFLTIIITSFLGVQILSLLNHNKEEMIRYIAMCIGAFVHLFVLNYPGQRIIDYSTDIFHKAYNMLWYKMSRRSTQLLSILLHRCFVPCTLTAGKIYVLSMTNYASMVQACMSYFTAFSSFN